MTGPASLGRCPCTPIQWACWLNFLFPLQDLTYSSSCCQDDILSFEPDKQAVYQQVYRPVYFQLVDVLLHKAQFPSDEEYGFWSSDEKEQFRIYRYSWGLPFPR